ncbi:MAG: helix-turn-helix transcriptional regulator [Adlercreutzia sp.]|nr:helix-turn-helix transcriptional regulator [Adlercreutzia sp.]
MVLQDKEERRTPNAGGEGAQDAPAANRAAPFLATTLDSARARLLFGFAAFSAWVNLLVCFEGFLRDTVIYGGGVVHDPFFIAAMVVGGIALIVLSQASPRITGESEARSLALCVLGCVAGGGGAALSAVATSASPGLAVASATLGAACGIFIAHGTLRWGLIITSFDIREMVFVLCAALCLQWVPFIADTAFGAPGKIALAVLLPLISWWGQRGLREAIGAAEQPQAATGGSPADLTRIVARVGSALFCFAFAVEFVWASNVLMTDTPLEQTLFWLVYVFVLGASTAVMIFILRLMERWGAYRMELFYRAAFAFGVAGSAALPLALNHLFFSYAVIYVAYALICATMWMLAWSVVFMRHGPARRVVGIVFGLQSLALPCGFAAAKLMRALLGGTVAAAGALPYVSFAAIIVLVAAYAFLLPERTLLLLSPRLLKLSHESLDERCREVAARYGLTERETEIFTLLARGRDVGYIEKELFISRNTVNTHRKNLYRKLGIHTQQELLSLIEDSLS